MAMAIDIFGVKASVLPFLPTFFYSTVGGALATVRIDVLLKIGVEINKRTNSITLRNRGAVTQPGPIHPCPQTEKLEQCMQSSHAVSPIGVYGASDWTDLLDLLDLRWGGRRGSGRAERAGNLIPHIHVHCTACLGVIYTSAGVIKTSALHAKPTMPFS